MTDELDFPFLRLLQGEARLTQTSLELPQKLTAKQWEDIGRGLGKIEQATQWWVGDWWAFGENKQYGERKAIVESEEWTGPAFQTCMNSASVCRAFETSLRREVLSWYHHKELASIKDLCLRESLLDWCEEPLKNGRKKPRSIRELQNEIVVRHNNHFFDCACREIDHVLKAYADRDSGTLKEVKGKIILLLTALIKQRNQEKISVTEMELHRIIVDTAAEILGSVRGDVKMLTEFIGPIRRLAERTDFNFDEMVKAEPSRLIDSDVKYCQIVSQMIDIFIEKLRVKK